LLRSKKNYDEFTSLTYEEAKEYIKGTENQRVRERIANIVNESKVLDVGCANGIDAARFKPQHYIGIDISPELVHVAKERFPNHTFLVGEAKNIICKFKKEGKNFDFVICKAVLEHLPNEINALDLFKSMLEISNHLLVAWHNPPRGKRTKIVMLHGHFGKIIYQNTYKESLFDLPRLRVDKEIIDNYELWHVRKI